METFINEIKTLVTKGKLSRALKKLNKLDKEELDDLADNIFLLQSRFSKLESDEMMSVISSENARLERNKITLALLSTLEEMEELTITVPGDEPQKPRTVIPDRDDTPSGNVKKILFLASNPKDSGRLRLGEELRDIEEGLKLSQNWDKFNLKSKFAVRAKDLSRAMLEIEPQIIHFSGHGVLLNASAGDSISAEGTRALEWEEDEDDNSLEGYSGGIALEDGDGNTKIVKADALAGLFELFGENIECVVLNACYSDAQGDALIKHVPYVVGMNTAVPDATAIAFATGFYDSLAVGKDIEFSFKIAKNRIALEDMPGADIPVLRKRETS